MLDYRPPKADAEIIYQDDAILVVNKPANLLSVPGRRPEHQDCLIARIQQRHPEALIVHRLDMSTSGLLILARSSAVQRNLNQQFEQRLVKKTYLAIVAGRIETGRGQIDLPLICDWPNRPRQMVDYQQGKPAQTNYRLIGYDSETDTSRVELQPLTGRTHQLRVHMLALGHPILGDDLYADENALNQAERLLLHASALAIAHPVTGKTMLFNNATPF